MPSRKIEDCHPALQPILKEFLARCQAAGMNILVTCTYHSGAEQDALYMQGRTKPGAKVANAKAGQTRHNDTLNGRPTSTAFDIVPLIDGKAVWDAKHPHWQKAGEIGEALGLEWAARWVTFKEMPHFQLKRQP